MDGIEWWRWFLLAVLFAGLGWSAWWARQRNLHGRAAGQGRLHVAESRWLDARTAVSLVECDGRTFLLARHTGGGVAWQPVEAPSPRRPQS